MCDVIVMFESVIFIFNDLILQRICSRLIETKKTELRIRSYINRSEKINL